MVFGTELGVCLRFQGFGFRVWAFGTELFFGGGFMVVEIWDRAWGLGFWVL